MDVSLEDSVPRLETTPPFENTDTSALLGCIIESYPIIYNGLYELYRTNDAAGKAESLRHSIHVACIADQVATKLNLGLKERFTLAVAALIHDVGKTQISEHMPQKGERLASDDPRIAIIRDGHMAGLMEFLDKIPPGTFDLDLLNNVKATAITVHNIFPNFPSKVKYPSQEITNAYFDKVKEQDKSMVRLLQYILSLSDKLDRSGTGYIQNGRSEAAQYFQDIVSQTKDVYISENQLHQVLNEVLEVELSEKVTAPVYNLIALSHQE